MRAGAAPGNGRVRVAILGGGAAGLTAALALTDEAQGGKYDVTVYQMGWRLGGKGASGRNPDRGHRIEEHGIHIWFGFYENAFRVLKPCYEEIAKKHPERLFKQCIGDKPNDEHAAFLPHEHFFVNELREDGKTWDMWDLFAERNDLRPGDDSRLGPKQTLAWRKMSAMLKSVLDLETHEAPLLPKVSPVSPKNDQERRDLEALREIVLGPSASLEAAERPLPASRYLEGALQVFASPGLPEPIAKRAPEATLESKPLGWIACNKVRFLAFCQRRARDIVGAAARRFPDNRLLHRLYLTLDTFAAVLTGLSRDLFDRGKTDLDELDAKDLRRWLLKHGADPKWIEQNPTVRFVYNSAFSFEDGNHQTPRMAAGAAVRGMLRVFLTYKGALAYRMHAGMGDVVFSPLYEVLHERKVKFRFFHRVEGLTLGKGENGSSGPVVDRIRLTKQVRLKKGLEEYNPLYNVRNVMVWPNSPLYDQIENGQALKAAIEKDGLNLEDPSSRFDGEEESVELRRGPEHEFDQVILGIPIGAHKTVCSELLAHRQLKHRWQRSVDKVATTPTQAYQVWFRESFRGLGWKGGNRSPILGTYEDPIDTCIDMTPAARDTEMQEDIKSLAYFCGVIKRRPRETHASSMKRAQDSCFKHFIGRSGYIWSGLKPTRGTGPVDWRLVETGISHVGRSDRELFDTQYARVNALPSDQYTLALPGSSQHRLAVDEFHKQNLWLAGDWTSNPMNLGCVEAAVMSGLLCTEKLSGVNQKVIGADDRLLWTAAGIADDALEAAAPEVNDAVVTDYLIAPGEPMPREQGSKAAPRSAVWNDKGGVKRLEEALATYAHEEASRLCGALERKLRSSSKPYPADRATEVLQVLQEHRNFELIERVAEALLETGCDSPGVRRRYAQALIELGALAPAMALLEPLVKQKMDRYEAGEAAGLLGRARKQAFVRAGGATLAARRSLAEAVDYYYRFYRKSPRAHLWHGINAVALIARARRDGIRLRNKTPAPAKIARKILDVIKDTPEREIDHWTCGTATQATLALGKKFQIEGLRWAERYVRHPKTSAFSIASTLRQMTEIWQLDPSSEPGKSLLPIWRGGLGQKPGGSVTLDLARLQGPVPSLTAQLQKTFGKDGPASYRWLLNAVERLRLVGRVESLGPVAMGTGFLVRASDCRGRVPRDIADGEVLLMTNAHVLSRGDYGAVTPANAQVRFQALTDDGNLVVRVDRVIWESPPDTASDGLDATIATLKWSDQHRDLLEKILMFPVVRWQSQKEGNDRVYVIGHPKGGELSISLHDSLVVGADNKRLHYRTPTDGGSSGSPVFNHDWCLIALHHAGHQQMSRIDGQGTYEANEGIRIEAVLGAGHQVRGAHGIAKNAHPEPRPLRPSGAAANRRAPRIPG